MEAQYWQFSWLFFLNFWRPLLCARGFTGITCFANVCGDWAEQKMCSRYRSGRGPALSPRRASFDLAPQLASSPRTSRTPKSFAGVRFALRSTVLEIFAKTCFDLPVYSRRALPLQNTPEIEGGGFDQFRDSDWINR
jgi:hypothetical protein